MDDRFDQRLRERLAALDAAVPAEERAESPSEDLVKVRLRRVRSGSQSRAARPLGLVAAVSSLLVIAVVAAVVAQRPTETTEPASQTGATAATQVAVTVTPTAPGLLTGADGIPTQIDRQPVHTMLDQSAWPTNSDSFLLAAKPSISAMACPPGANLASPPYTSAEAEFLTGMCDYASLSPVGTAPGAAGQWLAPKSPAFSQLFVWSMAGAPLVMRVHTHDSKAALCTAARLVQCQESVVVEAILWPTIPSQFDGQHVYGGDEINAAAAAGSIASLPHTLLLGGVVWAESASVIGCSPPSPNAQDALLSNCVPTITIGGAFVAPKSSFTAVTGQLVIVRGHVNDPLAAQCSADTQTACQDAFVVESVVWYEGPYPLGPRSSGPSPTPTLAPPLTTPRTAASTPS
jgi:hypothetical protein